MKGNMQVQALIETGRLEEAGRLLLRSLQRTPGNAALWQQLLELSSRPGTYGCAAQVHLAVANHYRAAGAMEQAQQAYRRAIRSRPGAAELHYNLGTLQQELGDYTGARQCYRQALKFNPALLQAWNNLGLVCQELGRLDDALTCFNRGLAASAGQDGAEVAVAELHRHRALLWLLQGDFARGWPEYEWRHTDPAAPRRSLAKPAWDGRLPLAGKTILVCAEQGVGDEIMFAAMVPALQREAQQVLLECDLRLVPLFLRSFEGIHTVARGSAAQLDAACTVCNLHVFAGSLPGYLGVDRTATVVSGSFLKPSPDLLQKWRARYAGLGAGLKVGISWRGGAVPAKRARRSTALELWQDLFALPGVHFVNLQYGDCGMELEGLQARTGIRVHDWDDADPLRDLDDFAAQVAALDLVISVDNATVHLAGALGVPVWILQPFIPEWRWLMDAEESYWYKSARQFRQQQPGDWSGVFARLARSLEERICNR